MAIVAIVAVLAIIEYLVFAMLVGRARGLYGVQAPATSGHEMFDRYYRVQQNTVEQLIAFLPGLWIFANYVSPLWAALVGVIFIVGRVVYLIGYTKDPESRGAGFVLSFIPTVILVVGGLIGLIVDLLS
ncbi:MAG: MAPEG family protein [Pseudomonadales bacterium]|jgi:glutathione S-transferase|nr:MAPEG family protein [Pseudomonadales bacterium]MDP7594976.1 MAPEG family protein [Pseudomonadales bacterium]HJN51234.1 MAPEG family protein [Pseudomonadales bacterium]|tara:strand:- start:512 stop:898 length:387 start_codon:yes stop_codon:yes gene_type:complete